jgi:hypothetical protein
MTNNSFKPTIKVPPRWAWRYVLGILVSAQGQILKASLDNAVNGSPFLTNEHRAKVMSLPGA